MRSFFSPAAVFTLMIFAYLTNAQLDSYVKHVCSAEDGKYTSSSTYRSNLNSLLTTLPSNQNITYGFYNFSAGDEPDKVSVIALCRGDISLNDCRACLNYSTVDIVNRCPNEKKAIIWYDHCMLRYSNRSIFGRADEGANYFSRLVQDANDSEHVLLISQLYNLLYSLRDKAAAGNSTLKFAIGHTNMTDFGVIYGLVQCTPDLSHMTCGTCLDGIIYYFKQALSGNERGSSYGASCFVRYSPEQFYGRNVDGAPVEVPSAISPLQVLEGYKHSKWVIIIITALIPCLVALLLSICFILRRKLSRRENSQYDFEDIRTRKSLQYDLSTIKLATVNFSEKNKIGEGGFGSVYKGKLADGEQIAVKRLAAGSGQGELEFKNEVMIVAKLRHRNLVKLLGFCVEGLERLLVYEFMPNTSLDQLLNDANKRASLNWENRYMIIEGIAKGLLYLHEDSRLRIIHRDLKTSNVLLDYELQPKIADFGTARLFDMDETRGSTSRIVGTPVYMAPEYVMRGQFSTKSDVYSFGVLILELMSGQKIAHFCVQGNAEHLINYGWECWNTGRVTEMVDQAISNGPEDDMRKCLQIGLLCLQEMPMARPTMASVVQMLSDKLHTLPLPPKPSFPHFF